jgi:hypothetical protein
MQGLSDEQAANMAALLDEFPEPRRVKFLAEVAGVTRDRLTDIPQKRFAEFMAMLERARKGGTR